MLTAIANHRSPNTLHLVHFKLRLDINQRKAVKIISNPEGITGQQTKPEIMKSFTR